MRPRDAEVDTLDVFAWNPHQGRRWRDLRGVLDQQAGVHLIVLNEVWRHGDELARWAARNGYVVHQEDRPGNVSHIPEEGSTALLIRNDLEVLSSRVVVMLTPWKVFSHNKWRRPRRYLRARLLVGKDWRVKVTASHWPTNGFKGGNRVAFAESAARAASTFATTRGTCLDIGDHNESVPVLRLWAKPLGATVVGQGPDSAIVKDADVTMQSLGKFGLDDPAPHNAVRYRITRTPAKRRK